MHWGEPEVKTANRNMDQTDPRIFKKQNVMQCAASLFSSGLAQHLLDCRWEDQDHADALLLKTISLA